MAQGTDVRNRLYFIDLDNPGKPKINNPVFRLIDRLDAEYEFVGNRGTMFYVRTDRNAPKGRIVAISIENPREERWNTIVAESKDALVTATTAGEDIVAITSRTRGPASASSRQSDDRRIIGSAVSRRRGEIPGAFTTTPPGQPWPGASS